MVCRVQRHRNAGVPATTRSSTRELTNSVKERPLTSATAQIAVNILLHLLLHQRPQNPRCAQPGCSLVCQPRHSRLRLSLTRAQSAYTHLALRSTGELFAARLGRSACGTCTPARAKHYLKPLLCQTLLSLLKTLPAESGESLSDPSPPLGAAAPLGVSLGGYTSNPARVLLPARGLLRDHSVLSRLSCQRVLTYTWASGYFRKGRKTAADVAAVRSKRRHTSG